jgi:hypothetical protein
MKSSLALFVLVMLLLNILVGCAPSANQFKGVCWTIFFVAMLFVLFPATDGQ